MRKIHMLGLMLAAMLITMNTAGAFAEKEQDDDVLWIAVTQPEGALQEGGLNGAQLGAGGGMSAFSLSQNVMIALCGRIGDAMESFRTAVDISGLSLPYNESTVSDIMTCISATLNSNPQYFMYKSGFSCSVASAAIVAITLQLRGDESAARAERAIYLAGVDEALRDALPVTEYDGDLSNDVLNATEKALALHDYLAVHTRYHHDASALLDATQRLTLYPNAFNAYGALVEKHAVCQGIALAYSSLLKAVSVDCYIAISKNLSHAWNLVKTETSGWYYVDVTWDDPTFGIEHNDDGDWMGYCGHTCFMMNETELETDRFTAIENDTDIGIVGGTAPQTPAEPHPASSFWHAVQSGMYYYLGYWYYNDGSVFLDYTMQAYTRGALRKAPYATDGNMGTVVADNASFPAFYRNMICYFDHNSHSLTRYDLHNGNAAVLLSFSQEDRVSEMAVGELNLKAYDHGSDYLVPDGWLVFIQHADGSAIVNLLRVLNMPGDVTGDGMINVADVIMLCRSLVGATQLSGEALEAADFDGDGTITLADALALCRTVGATS